MTPVASGFLINPEAESLPNASACMKAIPVADTGMLSAAFGFEPTPILGYSGKFQDSRRGDSYKQVVYKDDEDEALPQGINVNIPCSCLCYPKKDAYILLEGLDFSAKLLKKVHDETCPLLGELLRTARSDATDIVCPDVVSREALAIVDDWGDSLREVTEIYYV
jgi:hypothetical protein